MLSDRSIREINDEIQRAMRDARTSFDHDEKMAAYERVSKLKSILDPEATSREDILQELATAIVATSKVVAQPKPQEPPTLIELIFGQTR